jgi:ATP-binding cassette subfamily C (CFTR/MRP) protein 1
LQLAYTVPAITGTAITALLAARLLSLVAYAAFCVLSILEHGRSVTPSTLLTVYLVFSAFSDAIQLGLLYVAKNLCSPSALSLAIFIARLALLVLEAQNKTSILREPYRHLAPEETAGFFGSAFFWWVNGIIALGYSKILSVQDMPPLASYLDTMKMREAMQRTWDKRSTPLTIAPPPPPPLTNVFSTPLTENCRKT